MTEHKACAIFDAGRGEVGVVMRTDSATAGAAARLCVAMTAAALLIPGAAAAADHMVGAPQGTARANAAATSRAARPEKPYGSATWLKTIVVNGTKVPLPVALQIIKNALHRPWSNNPKDGDVLVCRTPKMLGSLFHTVRCETNAEYLLQKRQTETALSVGEAHAGDTIPAEVAEWTNSHWVNPGALRRLLSKLPPADSSYSLKIKDHGRVEAEYVFEKGRLVKIWKRSNHGD